MNYLLREVLHGSADDVIDDRATVDGDLCGATGLPGYGHARIVCLGRVEVAALDLLDAWLELCEVQKIPPIEWQILDLPCVYDARNGIICTVYLDFTAA